MEMSGRTGKQSRSACPIWNTPNPLHVGEGALLFLAAFFDLRASHRASLHVARLKERYSSPLGPLMSSVPTTNGLLGDIKARDHSHHTRIPLRLWILSNHSWIHYGPCFR